MAFIKYTTKQGDRWDSISFDMYGDVKYMTEIIAANTEIPVDLAIPANTDLRIPVLDIQQTQNELLPPWKR